VVRDGNPCACRPRELSRDRFSWPTGKKVIQKGLLSERWPCSAKVCLSKPGRPRKRWWSATMRIFWRRAAEAGEAWVGVGVHRAGFQPVAPRGQPKFSFVFDSACIRTRIARSDGWATYRPSGCVDEKWDSGPSRRVRSGVIARDRASIVFSNLLTACGVKNVAWRSRFAALGQREWCCRTQLAPGLLHGAATILQRNIRPHDDELSNKNKNVLARSGDCLLPASSAHFNEAIEGSANYTGVSWGR